MYGIAGWAHTPGLNGGRDGTIRGKKIAGKGGSGGAKFSGAKTGRAREVNEVHSLQKDIDTIKKRLSRGPQNGR